MIKLRMKFKLFRARLVYNYAVYKAKQRNYMDGKRYYVVMSDNGKLMVIDKDVFYRIRHKGIMPKDIKPRMLTKIAVWYTRGMYKGKASAEMAEKQKDEKYEKYISYIQALKK